MDTDHYTLFFFKVGLYLDISISTCLYKEGTADRENKRRNKAAVYPPHAPDGALVGSVRVPRLHRGWAITQTQPLSFEIEIPIYTPRPVVFEESLSQFFNHLLREGNGTPLQYSCLENPMDGGAWWAAAHGVAKSQTRLSN